VRNVISKLVAFVRENLVIGLISAGPILGTIYVTFLFLSFLDNIFGGFYQKLIGIKIPGIGVITGFVLILLIGLFARTYLAKVAFGAFESSIARIPLVKTVYSAFKNVADMFQKGKGGFGRPVIIILEKMFIVGFEMNKENGNSYVLVPSVPNPTTGFIFIVPEKNVFYLSASSDEVLKFILSLGSYVRPLSELGKFREYLEKRHLEGKPYQS